MLLFITYADVAKIEWNFQSFYVVIENRFGGEVLFVKTNIFKMATLHETKYILTNPSGLIIALMKEYRSVYCIKTITF